MDIIIIINRRAQSDLKAHSLTVESLQVPYGNCHQERAVEIVELYLGICLFAEGVSLHGANLRLTFFVISRMPQPVRSLAADFGAGDSPSHLLLSRQRPTTYGD